MKYYRHIAQVVDDWVRVEVEYSGDYAHQLTEQIKNCQTDEQLKEIILCSILSRYMFFYTKSNKPHKITKLMINEYKIEQIYGKECVLEFLDYLMNEYNSFYFPNNDVLIWIKKHKDSYLKQSLPWRKED